MFMIHRKEMIHMHLIYSEHTITQFIDEHPILISKLDRLYDSTYKKFLTDHKLNFADYILINTVNYDSLRPYASSLSTYAEAFFNEVPISQFFDYLSKFYSIFHNQIDAALNTEPATTLITWFYSRVIYRFYIGTHYELLIQQAINAVNLSATYDKSLDFRGIDLLVSNGSQSLALQIKSSANFEHTTKRMARTSKAMEQFTTDTGITTAYLFYDKDNEAVKVRTGNGWTQYLFTTESYQQLQQQHTGLHSVPINEAVQFIDTYLWLHSSDNTMKGIDKDE